ncbi:MAG: S8 family serine peptidase, partial [Myxococcales bacterium]|nr:S8 family serine peptidase [Myxococcales bacterium]
MRLDERLDEDERVETSEPMYDYSIGRQERLDGTPAVYADDEPGPNDPLYQFQWHLHQIDAYQAWSASRGTGIVVAVIDTGVLYADSGDRFRKVEDLNAFVPGYDFVDDDEEPLDEHGHGTHVAGSVAQTTDNEYGGAGVAPGA